MTYIDQHTHTNASVDSTAEMKDMVERAEALGLDAICFTDHCDLIYYDQAGVKDPDCKKLWSRCLSEYEQVLRSFKGNLKIRIGMELGEINQDAEMAKDCYATEGLDFILGSVHAVRNHTDFCLIEYTSKELGYELVSQYLDENIETAKLGYFDVLAHIGYTIRYMSQQGVYVDYGDFTDKIRELYKVIIEKGKGIEINTSGLRQGAGTTFPTVDMIKLYRQMGGEIITIGSDAHRPQDIAANFHEAFDILTGAGFKYFSVFSQHKPEFIRL